MAKAAELCLLSTAVVPTARIPGAILDGCRRANDATTSA